MAMAMAGAPPPKPMGAPPGHPAAAAAAWGGALLPRPMMPPGAVPGMGMGMPGMPGVGVGMGGGMPPQMMMTAPRPPAGPPPAAMYGAPGNNVPAPGAPPLPTAGKWVPPFR
jgi:hypothetical protein